MAAALAHLLADHPELRAIVWVVGETPGVLAGYQMAAPDQGANVDTCAEIMGGHVARTSHWRDDDGYGLAQLVTTFDGVLVHVCASYLLPTSKLTADELKDLLTGRRATQGGDVQ
ncbi:hypothetical protein [Streptomyces afghaniensis]|uniref:hypothetical protein n=1 Tax=Streptomyces afghaniensis TaxID=66865 RepID=UPI00278696E2|nr:hypothetical protein [Streptomyces afghaniensis]MDQ1018794.1 hypothetical protein [Streptomyces afghaniensis]